MPDKRSNSRVESNSATTTLSQSRPLGVQQESEPIPSHRSKAARDQAQYRFGSASYSPPGPHPTASTFLAQPIEHHLITSTVTQKLNSTIDLRQQRVVHFTDTCRSGSAGQSCTAVHCSRGKSVEDQHRRPFSTSTPCPAVQSADVSSLDDILHSLEQDYTNHMSPLMDKRRSTDPWRSNFLSKRDLFSVCQHQRQRLISPNVAALKHASSSQAYSGSGSFVVTRSRSYDDVTNYVRGSSKMDHEEQLKVHSAKSHLPNCAVGDHGLSTKTNGSLSVFWKQAVHSDKKPESHGGRKSNGFTNLQHSSSWSAWDSVVRCILSDSDSRDASRPASPRKYLNSASHVQNGYGSNSDNASQLTSAHDRWKKNRAGNKQPRTPASPPNFAELDLVVGNIASSDGRVIGLSARKPQLDDQDGCSGSANSASSAQQRRVGSGSCSPASSASYSTISQPLQHQNMLTSEPCSVAAVAVRSATEGIDFLSFSSPGHKRIPREWSISREKLERLKQLSNSLSCSVARRVSQFDNKTIWQQAQGFGANFALKADKVRSSGIKPWDAVLPVSELPVERTFCATPTLPVVKLKVTPNVEQVSRSTSDVNLKIKIPKFYFPYGRPSDKKTDSMPADVVHLFNKNNNRLCGANIDQLLKALDLSVFLRKALLHLRPEGNNSSELTFQEFFLIWKRIFCKFHDEASRFVRLLAEPRTNFLTFKDLIPLIQEIIDSHVGLVTLKKAKEFHLRYIHTVVARIFFNVNRSWSGKITIEELRRSNFLQMLKRLEDEKEVNLITDFFSYEHFYVIYCNFWKLDEDHDLYIDKIDLSRYSDYAISPLVIDRIFSGAVHTSLVSGNEMMSYAEFVWFIIAEEDKNHPTSIEYWFRCLDLDGDGYLSMYELSCFYEQQVKRMRQLHVEPLNFTDVICQLLDIVKPVDSSKISLSDLKKCKVAPLFYNTFTNLGKYLHDEFLKEYGYTESIKTGGEDSDWNRFAAKEYDLLLAETGEA